MRVNVDAYIAYVFLLRIYSGVRYVLQFI